MESMFKDGYFVPRKRFNYLTGWEELKEHKKPSNNEKGHNAIKINGKTIGFNEGSR
jgi:hypothetical protein